MRGMKRYLGFCVALVFAFNIIPIKQSSYALTRDNYAPLIERESVAISRGNPVDLSHDANASRVLQLEEASVVVTFQSNSSEPYQSLFSVSNPTWNNPDRHFHIYVTADGRVGFELRNTDSVFKYTGISDYVLRQNAENSVAFVANKTDRTYKLYANGDLVATVNKSPYYFWPDITGLTKISLGATVRRGNQYPFSGEIHHFALYEESLTDIEAKAMTDVDNSSTGNLIFDATHLSVITPGSPINEDSHLSTFKNLSEGTVVVKFSNTHDGAVQSLFSVANGSSGNRNRHFHFYITNTGALGFELRNTDIVFKEVLARPAVLQGKYHGVPAENTVAFRADRETQTYSIFANGRKIESTYVEDYRFLKDITGLDSVTIGACKRDGVYDYQFGGNVQEVKVYSYDLSDEELIQKTSETQYSDAMFYQGDSTNSSYYRIPALLTLKSGVVVSSIDARYGGTHDARSNIDIAFSRSTDGGRTWSEPTLPMQFDDYAAQTLDWPRDDKGKNIQISGSASFIDTVLLQDEITGRLFLFADAFTYGKGFNNAAVGTGFKEINGKKYLKLHWHEDFSTQYNYSIRENGVIFDDRTNQATEYSVDGDYRIMKNGQYLTQKQYQVRIAGNQVFEERTNVDVNMCVFYKDSVFQLLPTNYLTYKYSDDDGLSWSDLNILGDFRDVNQRMLLFGPGRGTQIKNGPLAGRLIISAYNSMSGDYGYLYSDNHGESWTFVNTDLGSSGTTAEAQIVELPNGTLCTFMRTNLGKIAYNMSLDGGETWSEINYLNNLSVARYGTQLSVINYSQTIDGSSAIILSTPTHGSERRGGKIFVGTIVDTGRNGYEKYRIDWSDGYEVDHPAYGFSYSCLTELPNGNIALLYEKYDSWSRNELHLEDVLKYDVFNIEELVS